MKEVMCKIYLNVKLEAGDNFKKLVKYVGEKKIIIIIRGVFNFRVRQIFR